MPNLVAVGYGCFYDLAVLTELQLPNVETIDANTIAECENLSRLYAPKLVSLKNSNLYNCPRLKEIIWSGNK